MPDSRQVFEVTEVRSSGLVNIVHFSQTVSDCEHRFVDKPIVTTEPSLPSVRLLGLGSKLYPSNIQRMLNKDLARFMQSY